MLGRCQNEPAMGSAIRRPAHDAKNARAKTFFVGWQMSIGDGAFHFSASGFPDAKDLQEATRIRLAAWHIVTGVDVPYCAGYSQYPRKRIVYIDKDVPQFWTDARGKKLDVWHGSLFWHESIECDLLNSYPDEHYAGAHTVATYVENMYVQAL